MVHGSDPFGSHRIAELVQTIQPDLVWVTNDLWVAVNLWEAVKPLKEKIPFKFFIHKFFKKTYLLNFVSLEIFCNFFVLS